MIGQFWEKWDRKSGPVKPGGTERKWGGSTAPPLFLPSFKLDQVERAINLWGWDQSIALAGKAIDAYGYAENVREVGKGISNWWYNKPNMHRLTMDELRFGKRRLRPTSRYQRGQRRMTASAKWRSRARGRVGRRTWNVRTGGYLNIEKKFQDFTLAGFNQLEGVANATQLPVNIIKQGDGERERIGRQISQKALTWRVTFTRLSSETDVRVNSGVYACHVAIVIDTQCNGAVFDIDTLYQDGSLVSPAVEFMGPLRNLEYTPRYQVLKHQMKLMGPGEFWGTTAGSTSAGRGSVVVGVKGSIDLKGFKTQFIGTTASVANITDNAIYVMAWWHAEGLIGTGTAVSVEAGARLRYTS